MAGDQTKGLFRFSPSVPMLGKSGTLCKQIGHLPSCSWRSLFFYLCARLIEFAPLKSQGLEMRARYIQEKADKDPHAPPPCSPKTIHSLAVAVSFCCIYAPLGFLRYSLPDDQLGIKPLQDLALKEIESKITSANIVDEFFASPTSRWVFSFLMERSPW